MEKYSVIIIDDERLAREEIKRYLNLLPEYEIVGEANNADNGKALIETKRPHLIFLDIQMPEKTGFDLLNELTIVPEIVFTTAYSEYATKAFDVNALDYLVKPISEERFLKSMEKVKKEFSKTRPKRTTFSIQHKIFIKDGTKCHFIPLSDIRYIESLENYARFHFNGNKAMFKQSLNNIEKKLDATVFFRVNRSQIINTQYITEVYTDSKNRLKIVFTTGETFDVSSRQSVRFKNRNSL